MTPRNFVWYDLVTSDKAAAQAFYGKVIGWGTQDVSQPGMPYIIFTNGPAMAAGYERKAAFLDELCSCR